jgi:hypothetical protein
VTSKQFELLVHGFEVKDMNKTTREENGEGKALSPNSGIKEGESSSPMRKNVHTSKVDEVGTEYEADYVLKSPTRINIGGGETQSPVRVRPSIETEYREPVNKKIRKFSSRRPPTINARLT